MLAPLCIQVINEIIFLGNWHIEILAPSLLFQINKMFPGIRRQMVTIGLLKMNLHVKCWKTVHSFNICSHTSLLSISSFSLPSQLSLSYLFILSNTSSLNSCNLSHTVCTPLQNQNFSFKACKIRIHQFFLKI